jgi:hypothetical protein
MLTHRRELAPQDEKVGERHGARQGSTAALDAASMPSSHLLILRCEAKPSLEGRTAPMQVARDAMQAALT